MKSNRLSQILALTATVTLASFAVNAAEPLLSPRAQANRIRTVSGVTEDRLDRTWTGSPKAQSLEPRRVAGITENRLDRSPRLVSPRALELAQSHGRGGHGM